MPDQLTLEQIRRLRVHAQRLTPTAANTDVSATVFTCCALQSQELPAGTLSLRARTTGLTAESVRHAREGERGIILTWTMRGTMHLVHRDDVRWLLALMGQHFIKKTERRYKQLDLNADTRQRAGVLMRDLLGERGPLTRPEIATELGAHGIPVAGQAIAHLVRYAALAGIICYGPERDGDLTYVALDDWLPPSTAEATTPDRPIEELVRRYLRAYAPATIDDAITWSGLGAAQIKAAFKALATELVPVESPVDPMWLLPEQWDARHDAFAEHSVRLLPRYDAYLLGYKRRDFLVEPAHAKQIHPGGGLIRTSLIINGAAVATWKLEHKAAYSRIVVEPFAPLPSADLPRIEAEAADIGRFLGREMQLEITSS